MSQNNDPAQVKFQIKYLLVNFLAWLLCFVWIFLDLRDAFSQGISLVSPFIILLLVLNVLLLIIFGWMTSKAISDHNWTVQSIENTRKILTKGIPGDIVLAISLYGLFFCLIFLYSIETRSDFRITPSLEDAFIAVRSIMRRLEPLVAATAILFLSNLIWMRRFKVGPPSRYIRVLNPFALLVIPILLIIVYGIEQIDQRYFSEIFKEDHLLEWLTFWLLLVTGILGAALAWKKRGRGQNTFWFFALFGLFMILFSLEEISWGQRVFQIESTEFFLEHSDQQEINVHNVVQNWGNFRTNRVAGFILFIYGALAPIIPEKSTISQFFRKFGVVFPPRVLIGGFVLAALLMLPIFSGREEELGELAFSICLFIFVIFELLYFANETTD